MKKKLVGLAMLLAVSAKAQQPEKVYSIITEVKEISWYEGQQKAWRAVLEKTPTDGNAWMNLYAATRALRHLAPQENPEKEEELRTKHTEEIRKILTDLSKAMPQSFEYYYLTYSETGLSDSSENLLKAAAIRPYDPNILDLLMIHYETQRNTEKRNLYAAKMFEANDLPVGILNWGYNILSELDENAILFTAGDNDTYGTWLIQSVKKFRPDVTVVNFYMILLDDYRNQLFKEWGYEPLNISTEKNKTETAVLQERIFAHIFNGKRPVYVSTSASSLFEKTWSEQLYLTGLAYKYSKEPFDNTAIIQRNYEKRYLLDYLTEIFAFNIANLKGEEFNGMYLPSMIKLYQHYSETEEMTKRQELEKWLIRIARQCDREKEVSELLGKSLNNH